MFQEGRGGGGVRCCDPVRGRFEVELQDALFYVSRVRDPVSRHFLSRKRTLPAGAARRPRIWEDETWMSLRRRNPKPKNT